MIGLDLSLRRSAMVAVPTSWDGRMSSVVTSVFEPPKVARGDMIASLQRLHGLLEWSRSLPWELGPAFSERPAYRGSFVAHSLGEGIGAVKVGLFEHGCLVHEVEASAARKLLLGYNPSGRELAKKVVMSAWSSLGFPRAGDEDVCDAMTVLNYAMHRHGGFFFASGGTP